MAYTHFPLPPAAPLVFRRARLSTTQRFLRDLTAIRAMPAEADNQRPGQHLVNWGVVVTNAVGVVLGIALTSVTAGMFFLVWKLPTQQNEIIRTLGIIQEDQRRMADELQRLELNDRRQDDRLTRIESGN